MYIYIFFAPFCSYDSREMTDLRPDRPDLWSEPSAFGDRAHFRVSSQPAVLSVTGVQRFDAGTYTCRVDFRQSPTVYHHVKLDVIGKILYLSPDGTIENNAGFKPHFTATQSNTKIQTLDVRYHA